VQISSQIITNKPTPSFLQADALPLPNQQCQSTEGNVKALFSTETKYFRNKSGKVLLEHRVVESTSRCPGRKGTAVFCK